MLVEKLAALLKNQWRRKDPFDVTEPGAAMADQMMDDAEFDFTDNFKVIFQQEIIILMNASAERILYRKHAEIDLSGLYRFKNSFKRRCRHTGHLGAEILHAGLVAESSHFS